MHAYFSTGRALKQSPIFTKSRITKSVWYVIKCCQYIKNLTEFSWSTNKQTGNIIDAQDQRRFFFPFLVTRETNLDQPLSGKWKWKVLLSPNKPEKKSSNWHRPYSIMGKPLNYISLLSTGLHHQISIMKNITKGKTWKDTWNDAS